MLLCSRLVNAEVDPGQTVLPGVNGRTWLIFGDADTSGVGVNLIALLR